jgi:hypothetical protein
VTLAARSGCGAITLVQFGVAGHAFDNASVTITSSLGAPSGQTAGFTFTPPGGATSIAFTIGRVAQSGGATVSPLRLTDGCGEWSTFVGGGPDAFR